MGFILPHGGYRKLLSYQKAEIVYEDFDKLGLRIGTVLTEEKVQKSDKLLKLEVDLGFEKRTIVSGIAQHFTPEELLETVEEVLRVASGVRKHHDLFLPVLAEAFADIKRPPRWGINE